MKIEIRPEIGWKKLIDDRILNFKPSNTSTPLIN